MTSFNAGGLNALLAEVKLQEEGDIAAEIILEQSKSSASFDVVVRIVLPNPSLINVSLTKYII